MKPQSFLYFLPSHTGNVSPDDIAAKGLSYAFKNPGLKNMGRDQGGPGGAVGALISDRDRVESQFNKYVKDRQTWELHEAGGYWVGMWNDAKPTPEVLERPDMLPGLKVKLGDGNEWVVPMARRWSMEDDPEAWPEAECELKTKVRFVTKKGDPQIQIDYGSIQEKYAHLWAISQADARVRYGSATSLDEEMLSGANLYANTLRILQVNYALGPTECNLLGVFVRGVWQEVFDALNDAATWRALVEKKRLLLAESPSSSSGVTDSHLSTDLQPAMS